MSDEDRLDDLLVQWGEAREQGRELSAADLCADCPQLLDELTVRIENVKYVQRFIQLDDDSDDDFLHLPDFSTISKRADETRLPTTNLSLEEFCQRLVESELMEPDQVEAYRLSYPADDALSFARQLVTAKKLTRFQASALLSGKDLPLVLDRYILLDEIGAGGMGMVYKALHQQMDRVVALKILPKSAVDSADKVKRFQREVKAAAKLHHPNIVVAHDAREDKGVYFLVMEMVDGDDLSKIVQSKGPLSPARAVNYIAQAARGLEHAHNLGIVHRDIKPANLLRDKKGVVKILDMGLARIDNVEAEHDHTVSQQLTQAGMVMGTIAYVAPEQALDTRHADARSDMYSLGCTLYYLLCGRPIFSEDTMMKTLLAHREREIPSIKSNRIPAELETVFQKMVAKKPEDRFQTMTALIDALEELDLEEDEEELRELVTPTTQAMQETVTLLDTSREVVAPELAASQPPRKRNWGIPVVVACLLGLIGFGWAVASGVFLKVETKAGTIIVETDQPELAGAEVIVDGQKKITIKTGEGQEPIELTADEKTHTLKVVKGGFETFTKEFTVKAGMNQPIRVRLEPLKTEITTTGWHGWPADAPKPAIAPFDAEQAKKHQEAWAKYLGVPVEYENSIGMKFRLIPPGEFLMGSTPEEIEAALKLAGQDENWRAQAQSEGPQHKVILTQPIYVGVTELTQSQHEQVMGRNPSHFSANGEGKEAVAGLETGNHPVETVSWNDAVEFCAKLSQQEQLKPFYFRSGETVTPLQGTGYRLPTEAEWEYACRAGTTTRYWSGNEDNDLLQAGWFKTNSGNRTHAVGELKANPFGLFDVHGNVWEYSEDEFNKDYYSQFSEIPAVNPIRHSTENSNKLFRGGSWFNPLLNLRASHRLALPSDSHFNDRGFRVALPVDAVRQLLKSPIVRSEPQRAKAGPEDPQRRVAEMVIERGGSVGFQGPYYGAASKFEELPPGRFAIADINLYGNKQVTDADFELLKEICSLGVSIGGIQLGETNLSDETVRSIVSSDGAFYIAVDGRSVTDQAVALLADRANLHGLNIHHMPASPLLEQSLGNMHSLRLLEWGLYGAEGGITDDGVNILASLPNLRQLYLSGHGLTGERIALLAASKNLQFLELSGNPLTDDDIPHLATLKTLRYLNLTNTKVSNEAVRRLQESLPDCFIQHPDVAPREADQRVVQWTRSFSGVTTGFTGSKFGIIQELPTNNFFVQEVYFDPTHSPDGSEAKNLRGLKALQHIRWEGLKSADIAMETIGTLDSLDQFEISGSDISTAGMQNISKLKQLELLTLNGCKNLNDEAVSHLKQLPHLHNLQLNQTPITNAGLAHLGQMSGLRTLLLDYCRNINDDGLQHLVPFPRLRWLDLIGTPITDACIPSLSQMQNLRLLRINDTQITAEGAAKLQAALPMCVVFHESLNDTPWRMGKVVLEGDAAQLDGATITLDDLPARPVVKEDDQFVAYVYADDKPHKLKVSKEGLLSFTTELTAKVGEQNIPVEFKTPVGPEDLQRRVAEMVIERGGSVLCLGMGQTSASNLEDLPLGRFTVADIHLANESKVADTDMTQLAGSNYLRNLNLSGTHISDKGLFLLQHHTPDLSLSLDGTRITDAGITLLSTQGYPTYLGLGHLNLSDDACTHLSQMIGLRNLHLTNAALTDAGLKTLATCKSLRFLQLDGCQQVTGSGIAQLERAESLNELLLYRTLLDDSAIPQLGSLKNLRFLDIQETQITNEGANELQRLLPRCFIRHPAIPPSDANKRTVQWVLERGGRITATHYGYLQAVPSGNFSVSDLLFEDPANSPNGSEAKSLAGLRALHRLVWGGLRNADMAMQTIGTLDSLIDVNLFGSDISTSGMQYLAELKQLETLGLNSCNDVNDEGVSHLAGLKQLISMNIGSTPITNAGLASLCQITTLKSLSLSSCRSINNDGLQHLVSLPRLRWLDVIGTPLTDACIPYLSQMQKLRILDVTGTQITPEGAAKLQAALPKCVVFHESLNDTPWRMPESDVPTETSTIGQ